VVAEPQALDGAAPSRPGHLDGAVEGGRVLHVEREVEVRAHGVVELRQGGDVGREVVTIARGDAVSPQAPAHEAVVVEHRLAVSGEPHVALQARGAQPDGQREGLQRVLRGVGSGPTVGEPDRRATEGGQPSGHDGPLCQTGSSVKVGSPTS
jgi:hypothetical protein